MEEIQIDLKRELLATTQTSFARLLQLGGDAVALYMFFLYTSNYQDSKQVYATVSFCEKGLNWSRDRVTKARKALKDEGWIEDITTKTEKGTVKNHYVKVNYRVAKNQTTVYQGVEKPDAGKVPTNAPLGNKMHQEETKVTKVTEVLDKDKVTAVFSLMTSKGIDCSMFYKMKPQREAAVLLYNEKGLTKLEKALDYYNALKDLPFCPVIHNPYSFAANYNKLRDFIKKSQ